MRAPDHHDVLLVSNTVTFLFTDIEGSTRLWEETPGRMRTALAKHDAISRAAVESHRGVIVKVTGDGIHAAFDDSLNALVAAVDLQRSLADPAATDGVPLRVRCGLHAGIVEHRDNDFFGPPLNRAARIMNAAHGGQVLLSQAVVDDVQQILPAAVSLRDLGKVRLKDLSTPEHVYQVVHPQLRMDFPALRSLDATPNNLPQQLTSFIGREREIAEVKNLLRTTRLLTLLGMGGIGKTRLSLQVAAEVLDEYPDGLWFVELAPLTDAQLVPQAVASVLGVNEDAGRPVARALMKYVKDRRLLVVLDNCEHLAQACAGLVKQLLQSGPHVKILASSREVLRVAGETSYFVPTLTVPDPKSVVEFASLDQYDSIRLFVGRASAAQPKFQLNHQNAAAVADICHRLDGIPLALELAAARVRTLSVENIAARLGDRFRLLMGGDKTVLPRQQTLRTSIDWSHELLSEPERILFRRLSVFAGGWTPSSAEAVGADCESDQSQVLDILSQLVEKSLVEFEVGSDSIPRYRMLETTRAYGVERLTEAGEMPATLRRHAHAVLTVLEPFEQFEWRWRATGGAVPAAKVELDNLRAALEWADTAADARLAVALAGVSYVVWWSCSHLAEGLERCLALRQHVTAVPATVAARFWLTIAKLGVYSIQRESYEAAVRAAALYRELDDDQKRFEALTFAAVQGTRFATVPVTEAQIGEAAQLERPEWPARQRATLQFARCFWFARQGRFGEALASAQRQVAICRDGGVEVGALYSMANVTLMESLLGSPREALEHVRAALARMHALGIDAGAGHHYFSEMIALLMLDQTDEALTAAHNAYPRLLREGDQYRMLLPLALLNALHGRLDVAARLAAFDGRIQARSGENISIVAPWLRTRLEPLLASGLSADERTRLAAESSALDDDNAFKLALDNLA